LWDISIRSHKSRNVGFSVSPVDDDEDDEDDEDEEEGENSRMSAPALKLPDPSTLPIRTMESLVGSIKASRIDACRYLTTWLDSALTGLDVPGGTPSDMAIIDTLDGIIVLFFRWAMSSLSSILWCGLVHHGELCGGKIR
jgi:hypothetical protein